MPNTNHLKTTVKDSGDGEMTVQCFICRRTLTIPAEATAHENTKQYFRFADSHRHCGTIYDAYHSEIRTSQEAA